MRTLLTLLILIVLVLIVAIGSGMVNINQTQSAKLPELSVEGNGISASGGKQPTFDVETGSVSVGSETRAVTVPRLEVEPAPEVGDDAADAEASTPAGT